MRSAISLAAASCRLLARASVVVTRFTLLKVEEVFRIDLNRSENRYYDSIHDDDDDMTV